MYRFGLSVLFKRSLFSGTEWWDCKLLLLLLAAVDHSPLTAVDV